MFANFVTGSTKSPVEDGAFGCMESIIEAGDEPSIEAAQIFLSEQLAP